jgi:hypothetical protein
VQSIDAAARVMRITTEVEANGQTLNAHDPVLAAQQPDIAEADESSSWLASNGDWATLNEASWRLAGYRCLG